MKHFYPLLISFSILTLFSSCSKTAFWTMEERLRGTWTLTDVDRRGIGGGSDNVPLTEGTFNFMPEGKIEYTNRAGELYKGSWDLRHDRVGNDCYYDEYGNYKCDTRDVRALQLTLINFTTQDVLTEFFDEIVFSGDNKFKAYIYAGSRTWIFYFRRA